MLTNAAQGLGLHTHLAIYIPGGFLNFKVDPENDQRKAFRTWARAWASRQAGGPTPRAIRVRGPKVESPELHWQKVAYLMKGYDPSVVVQSARSSPDKLPVMLGDLIAWPWQDPGPVPLKKRVGNSQSLGPDWRAAGVPGCLASSYTVSETQLQAAMLLGTPTAMLQPVRPAFKSRYEDGVRDVRLLYPLHFYERVTGL